MSKQKAKFGADINALVERTRDATAKAGVRTKWKWEAYTPDGQLKWVDENHNLVVNQGLDKLLDIFIAGSSVASFATWKIGLVSGSAVSPAASWTYQGIGSSFTEATAYTGSRQAFTAGSVASQSVSNTASKASFTITGSSAISVIGAFMASGPNAVTKGNAAAGNVIYAISAFTSGVKNLDPADVLKVTITATSADDGV